MNIVTIGSLTALLLFSSTAGSRADDKADIAATEKALVKAFVAKDINTMMSFYAPDIFLFDDGGPPRQIVGAAAVRKMFESFFKVIGSVKAELGELTIESDGTLAYAHYVQSMIYTYKSGQQAKVAVRWTDIFRKINGRWLLVHEHGSMPYDYRNGRTDLSSNM